MERAYSLLTLKSVDESRRILTGIASTIQTDREGDVVEPKGAQFDLPLPFLWQHDSTQPIGHVTKATVTNGQISVEVQLAQIDEPGTLKDRLDEAWQSIKAGLVRGMSIGFKSVDAEQIPNSYGIRFVKWMWLELSAVTIPANAGASIQTIKSIDRTARAASGDIERPSVRLLRPGVSGKSTTIATKDHTVNIKEQIQALEATRAAKSARMAEVMTTSAKENRTTDAAEAEEVDTLTGEVKAIDADLVRLKAVEAMTIDKATPAAGQSSSAAAASRGGYATVKTQEVSEPGMDFARMSICLFKAKGDVDKAAKFSKQYYGQRETLNLAFKALTDFGSVEEVAKRFNPDVAKAAVPAESTSDSTYAGPLVAYNRLGQDLIEFLRPQTIIGKFGTNGIPSLRRIPFNVHIPQQTTGGAAGWVGQGKAKPVTRFGYQDVYLGWTKLAAITVMTQELARFADPAAETMFRQALTDVIVQRMDIDFIDPTNAGITGVKPASITNGVTATASAGGTAANIRTDIAALWAAPEAANLPMDSAVYITDARTALRLSLQQTTLGTLQFPGMTPRGGQLNGIPVIVSNNIVAASGGSYLILVFASEIFLADDGTVTVDMSTEASIEMSDAPTHDSVTPTAVQLVSMFQTNSMALRAERFINWAKRRPNAVSIVSGVNYSA